VDAAEIQLGLQIHLDLQQSMNGISTPLPIGHFGSGFPILQ